MAKPNLTNQESFTETLNRRLSDLIDGIKQLDGMAGEFSKPIADRVFKVISDQTAKSHKAWKDGVPNKYPKPTVAY